MVKRLLVFSDMSFDAMLQAERGAWDQTHGVLARAFAEAGYDLREIVHWDLAAGTRTPPVKTFLGEPEDTIDPDEVDEGALRMAQVKRDPKFVMMRAVS